jgi:hypothetical protein
MGPIICVAVMAHHSQIIWLWRGTSKICLRLVLLQDLLFWVSIHPLRWYQTSSVRNVSFGPKHCHILPSKKVTKMHFAFVIAVFSYFNLCYFLWLWLAQRSAQCMCCLRHSWVNFFHQFESGGWIMNMNTNILAMKPSFTCYVGFLFHITFVQKICCSNVDFNIVFITVTMRYGKVSVLHRCVNEPIWGLRK